MKAQFKYAFLSGIQIRVYFFAVIFVVDLTFIVLGSLGLLPAAALITAVSLGGVAIAAMFAANIIGDVAICRRMFSAPEAYLHALTPVPRWKTLLASVITMAALDIITMAFVIISEVWLSFNLAGIRGTVIEYFRTNVDASILLYGLWAALLIIAGYLLTVTLILFCITAKKSILFKRPASGLLAFLLGCLCVYAISISQLILAPLGTISRYAIFIILTFTSAVIPFYILLILADTAVLFVITAKLMERRINI